MSNDTEGTIVVHYLKDSRAQRLVWMLEELNVPYTIKFYKRTAQGLAPPELDMLHPMGKSPVITDGELVIAESGTIMEYLLETYGKGRFQPVTKEARLKNLYYLHSVEGSLMPFLISGLYYKLIPLKAPWFLRWILRPVMNAINNTFVAPNIIKAVQMIQNDLAKSTSGWIAGGPEPTAADFLLLFLVQNVIKPYEGYPPALEPEQVGPKFREWLEMVQKRPAYIRALDRIDGSESTQE